MHRVSVILTQTVDHFLIQSKIFFELTTSAYAVGGFSSPDFAIIKDGSAVQFLLTAVNIQFPTHQ